MQQVLVRIPTDTVLFLPIFVLLGLAIGAAVWAMFTRDRRSLPVFMGVAALVAYWLAGVLAERNPDGIPLYGYGMMLFLAFIACTALAAHLAKRAGIAVEHIQDLAIYLFVGGIIGSRVWYYIEEKAAGNIVDWSKFFHIWEGGLVFYGGVMGGAIAFVVAYYAIIKKHNLPTLKIADILAPCAALGVCLGRIGCLLNGCCYGEVACTTCAVTPMHFPLSGMPRQDLVNRGYQTDAGFLYTDDPEKPSGCLIRAVEPNSPAATVAELKAGDHLVKVDGREVENAAWLNWYLRDGWPRGKNDLALTVQRGTQTYDLPAFLPTTLGLYPTQLYETISGALIVFLLLAYYPFRRHDGELFALFLLLYPVHRFLDEMLRADNARLPDNLTMSQNGSILLFAIGLIFFLWLRRLPAQSLPVKKPATA